MFIRLFSFVTNPISILFWLKCVIIHCFLVLHQSSSRYKHKHVLISPDREESFPVLGAPFGEEKEEDINDIKIVDNHMNNNASIEKK